MKQTFFDIDKQRLTENGTLHEKSQQMMGTILHTNDVVAITRATIHPTEQQFRLISKQLFGGEQRERTFQAELIEEVRPQIERIMGRPLRLITKQAAPAPSQDDYDTMLTAFAITGEA